MNIVFVHGHMFNVKTWSQTRDILKKDDIHLYLFSQQQSAEKAMAFMDTETVEIFIGQLFHDLPFHDELLKSGKKAKMQMGLGWDMPADFSTFSHEQVVRFNQYLSKISVENYVHGIRYIASRAGADLHYQDPLPLQTHGIYHPAATEIFSSTAEYQSWFAKRSRRQRQGQVIGMLCYYGQIAENNHDDIDCFINAIEAHGMTPLCVFSEGAQDAAIPVEDRYQWLAYLKETTSPKSLQLAAIVNLMAGRLLSTPEDSRIFQDLNVPVFQTIRLYHQSPGQWARDAGSPGAGSFAMIYGLAQPEMAGVIEPTMAAGSVSYHDEGLGINARKYVPVPERIDHFCKRLQSWMQLKNLPNDQKKVTIVLNNNPCKGVDTLLITGLEFGNLKLMIQPKRGCYGAKCTGEVCRILHDPELSPPHHWLAVYHYIQKTSHVVIHFGTHGTLEFLPGKPVALSDECFPEISLGDLPNIYLYAMDVPGDGIVAKRRGRTVMVSHLTPVYQPAVADDDILKLEQLLNQYLSARDNNAGNRKGILKEQMTPLMKARHFLYHDDKGDNFDAETELLARRIAQLRRTLAPSGIHVIGSSPDAEGISSMLSTIFMKPSDRLPSLKEISAVSSQNPVTPFEAAKDVIKTIINGEKVCFPTHWDNKTAFDFEFWCRDIGGRISLSTREIPQLLKALNGEYIEPGLSGSLYLGKTDTLPTGRNFFTTDVRALPTPAAWEVGKILADNLLLKYFRKVLGSVSGALVPSSPTARFSVRFFTSWA